MSKKQTYPTKQSDDFLTIFTNEINLIRESVAALLLNLRTFAAIYIIPLLIAAVAALTINNTSSNKIETSQLGNISAVVLLSAAVALAGILVLAAILTIASIHTQLASVRGKTLSAKEAIDRSFPYISRVIILSMILVLTIIAGLVLFIVPGILAIFFLVMSIYVLIDKNTTPLEAAKESYKITKANWKIVLAYFLIIIGIDLINRLPIVGPVAYVALSIAYFCLPAIIYTRIQKQTPKSAK